MNEKIKSISGETLVHPSIDVQKVQELILGAESIVFDEHSISRIKEKGAADYVTAVDTGVQEYLRKELTQLYPEIGFMAEEQERFEGDPMKAYWILDPIDGTTNLIHHYQMSAISLGLYEKGKMTFGAVYNPFHKEMFLAVKGAGAYLNGTPIHVSEIAEMKFALASYGSSPYEKNLAHDLFELFEKIFMACSDFRRCGSAALDLCYVACGREDIYLEYNLKPWDYAAGALILEEAGGVFTGWFDDDMPVYIENGNICATNQKISEEFHQFLKNNLSWTKQ